MKPSASSKKSTCLINSLVIVCIFFYSLLVWWPTRLLPYHWDTPGFMIHGAIAIQNAHFNPTIPPGADFAHPPLVHLWLILFWQLLGFNFLATHLSSFVFLPIFLISTYFLIKKYLSLSGALWSVIFVAITPYILAEYGLVYVDLPAGALTNLGLTIWLYHRPKLSGFILSLAVLTKLTVLPAIVCLLIYTLLNQLTQKNLKSLKLIFPLCWPLVAALAWLLYHYLSLHWWLVLPGRTIVAPHTISEIFSSIRFVFYVFFIRQYHYLLTLIGVISSFYLFAKTKPPNRLTVFKPILLPVILIVGGLLSLALSGEYIPRYSIYLVPSYILVCLFPFYKLILNPKSRFLILIIIFGLSLTAIHPRLRPSNEYEFRVDEDLSYQDHIAVGLEAAHYLEVNFAEAQIVGSFPQTYQLTDPFMGYVTKPMNFIDCSHFSFIPNSFSLLYIHPYHNSQITCQNLLQQHPHQLITEFLVNGKWAQIYELTSKPVTR